MPHCPWARTPLSIAYHDREWGTPVHDDRTLFEFLILEGAQAGLSWETILNRREGYRAAFADFDPVKVARFAPAKQLKLLANPGIIRNRLKVAAAITNARAFLKVQHEFTTFDAYLWRFVDGRPIDNKPKTPADVPPRSPVSDTLSKDLKRRGFTFVGTTICYAMMQAIGMVNDHLTTCPRRAEIRKRL